MKLPPQTTRLLMFYAGAAIWNLANGIMMILIPLYALSLGFSILKIGSVIALPVLVMLAVRLVVGALCDRYGERCILQVCYLLAVIAALLLLRADDFASLLVSQGIANASRSLFWVASQSLATQLPGPTVGKRLGHLSAWNHVGNLLGMGLGGALASVVGYSGAFVVLTAMSIACGVLGLAIPRVESKPSGRTIWQIAGGIGRWVRHPEVWLGIFASFAAALPSTLTQSLFPVYLAQLEYEEHWIGLTVSGRAIGAIAMVLIIGPWITPPRLRGIFALGMVGIGIFMAGCGLLEGLLLLGSCIAALGAAGGVLDLWYQVQATEMSEARDRSMAMAAASLGWPLSLMIAPLLLGWLADLKGFPFTFIATGIFFLAMPAVSHLYYRRAESNATVQAREEVL